MAGVKHTKWQLWDTWDKYPGSIGKNVSDGCIRMHNKDVLELSNLVPVGTIVKII